MKNLKKNFIPVSLFQLFSIGIGPSSSHTVGPMRAAYSFALFLKDQGKLATVENVSIELFGSLAMTGHGHATDLAILLGLEGEKPELIHPDQVSVKVEKIKTEGALFLLGEKRIAFSYEKDLIFLRGKRLPFHSNAIKFKALDSKGNEIVSQIYYSVGGGFVIKHEEAISYCQEKEDDFDQDHVPYPFHTAAQLLSHCQATGLSIHEIVLANEETWRSKEEIYRGILGIWNVMKECVKRGCSQEGILPGGLQVKRRAAPLFKMLSTRSSQDPAEIFDWVSLFALAVNEENAAGGKVVTAPTNGASGVIPAVLHYYEKFTESPSNEGIYRFFLTAAAIGILYKEGASLSAAEMGCQGEVGVACSMAAGGLVAALGGSVLQVENAAEIGMEHNLGLTCDPVGGLVQIPCIERNTMGAIKAINAARLAMKNEEDYHGRVSLDQVIAAMRQTGEDMKSLYKETSEGGLALHVSIGLPEC
jgi:L-serine dehydratase